MDTLALRLLHARQQAQLSQEELAKRAGCSQGLIGNLESANQKTSSKLPRIAQVLGVEPLWLAEGRGQSKRQATDVAPEPFAPILDALRTLPVEEADLWVARVLTAAAEYRAEVARSRRQQPDPPWDAQHSKDRRAG